MKIIARIIGTTPRNHATTLAQAHGDEDHSKKRQSKGAKGMGH